MTGSIGGSGKANHVQISPTTKVTYTPAGPRCPKQPRCNIANLVERLRRRRHSHKEHPA